MRLSLTLASVALLTSSSIHAFSPQLPLRTITNKNAIQQQQRSIVPLSSSAVQESESGSESSPPAPTKSKKVTMITFDLDDTLYPIATILNEANSAFARAMEKFGFDNIEPNDIVETGKKIREKMAETDPVDAACLTHTEIRRLAIREEMEKIVYQRKLEACAEDWATQVSSLSPLVVQNAKTWATTAVSKSVVEAVLNAWEMERHHAAERHLYPEVMDTFEQIKEEHPNVVIGAVTDGKANPLFMTFTLAKHFDFCINWEDDQAGRQKFFKDLSNVEKDADLRWIYSAAKEKGEEFVRAGYTLRNEEYPDPNVEQIWIHIGDDLALDVGGSATCGAKTIMAELNDKQYHQTARHRFDNIGEDEKQPQWSSTPRKELEKRQQMNAAAEDLVNEKVAFISHIPEAINKILDDDEA
jgi:FMN phosphatase YigB (HAD superfamily)